MLVFIYLLTYQHSTSDVVIITLSAFTSNTFSETWKQVKDPEMWLNKHDYGFKWNLMTRFKVGHCQNSDAKVPETFDKTTSETILLKLEKMICIVVSKLMLMLKSTGILALRQTQRYFISHRKCRKMFNFEWPLLFFWCFFFNSHLKSIFFVTLFWAFNMFQNLFRVWFQLHLLHIIHTVLIVCLFSIHICINGGMCQKNVKYYDMIISLSI